MPLPLPGLPEPLLWDLPCLLECDFLSFLVLKPCLSFLDGDAAAVSGESFGLERWREPLVAVGDEASAEPDGDLPCLSFFLVDDDEDDEPGTMLALDPPPLLDFLWCFLLLLLLLPLALTEAPLPALATDAVDGVALATDAANALAH